MTVIACCHVRFSAVFSMPVWRKPISGVHLTTVSPSSSRMSRSTPWVLGWCGPTERIMRSPSNVSALRSLDA